MKTGAWSVAVLAAAALFASASFSSSVRAQRAADPGFKSVGRGAPLLADLNTFEMTGATTRAAHGRRQARSGGLHRLGSQWRVAARNQAAEGGPLHVQGLLQGP